ncbi:protein kinase family protein [Tepidibacter sp. Z1-5]|uniref:protein kinase family protein n=1 Tax=Tepidibacter sp. Z1-5 TaxID=3134138 RepID=UPI0030BD5D1C
MDITNYLENIKDEIGDENSNRLELLYNNIENETLKIIFSKIHFEVNSLLKYMNSRLKNGHYTANESRMLLNYMDIIDGLQSRLRETKFSFSINRYYKDILNKCMDFLVEYGGSSIPNGFKKIELLLTKPMFEIKNKIQVKTSNKETNYNIKLIGEGSYAKVFKYKDNHYNRTFAIKRAKKNLTKKEYNRFKKEYEEMSNLNSPYIIEVYRYDDSENEYTMEYVDYTLYEYINKNNNTIGIEERKNLVYQVLRAFNYLHNKSLLHRDISLTNTLIKEYDTLKVIKISDFGLVKTQESNLTSISSELKGSLNDPNLELYGFKNYEIRHETYALTRLIYFIMTGKTTINKSKLKNIELKNFVLKGLDNNLEKRYQNTCDIRNAFSKIKF